jgi:hypothetical protein
MQVFLQVGKGAVAMGYLEWGATALDRLAVLVPKQCYTGSSVAVPC